MVAVMCERRVWPSAIRPAADMRAVNHSLVANRDIMSA